MFRLKSLNKFQNFTTQRAFSNIQLENTFDRSNRIPLLSTLLLSTIGFLTVTTAVYTFVNTKYIFAESLHESMIVDQTDDKSLITQMTLDFDSIKASKDNINIYMYGSNSGRLIDPQSTETYIRNPRPIDVIFIMIYILFQYTSSSKERYYETWY